MGSFNYEFQDEQLFFHTFFVWILETEMIWKIIVLKSLYSYHNFS